ncbi:hypothetical protein HOC_03138 [Hyphomonas oceanitis SCH89]|uniref:Uncharacterized protein n=2 Tax=Hyphomonas oceanitis TaxID=81033 RepID=A0A059GAG9_9PROT|nr:hypothetical protein HOC_03138 [Hyphomonas oceanitis SCH89]
MKTIQKYVAALGAIALMSAAFSLPASAEAGVSNTSQTTIGVSVRVLGNDPNHVHPEFTYQGHQSNQWYPVAQVTRANAWDDARQGYDCYKAFQYTWVNHAKARQDTVFCFDAAGKEFEPDATRVSARLK